MRGPISRTLCAGCNRSTLLADPNQPDTSSAAFYQDAVANHYSRAIHERTADGKAHGFAFDDVGAYESLVHADDPRQACITLDPFDQGVPRAHERAAPARAEEGGAPLAAPVVGNAT